jgi:hypothetical protein
MVDKKITALTELAATPAPTDLFAIVDDVGGTPETKKISFRNAVGTRYAELECFSFRDEEPCSVADGVAYLHIPPDLNGLDLVYVHAEVRTAGVTGTMDIEVYNVTQAVDMLSTTLTIDTTETGSDTAAIPAVIDTANDDVATNDVLRIDIDAVQTTPAEGLVVTLGFR